MPRIQINVYCEDYPVMDDAVNHMYIKPIWIKKYWLNYAKFNVSCINRLGNQNQNITFKTQLYHNK